MSLREGEPFGAVPQYYAESGKLLSEYPDWLTMTVGEAPRAMDPSLGKALKQVDFVGYTPNPFYSAGKPYGQATAAAAVLRNRRVVSSFALGNTQGGKDPEAERLERQQRRAAAGGIVLPARWALGS